LAILYIIKGKIKLLFAKLDQHPRGAYSFTEKPADIFLSRNGSPQQNVEKVIEMMGGIEKFIGKQDIVVLKPNMQWWNQGRTNLAAMKGFIDLVLSIPEFSGEVIIAENNHFLDESLPNAEQDNIRGWTHMSEINGDIDGVNHNVNTMIEMYHNNGHKNVTKYHWRDGGPKLDLWGNGQKGGVISSPAEGDGYVWIDDIFHFSGYMGLKSWKVKMNYPVFTSSYSGVTIDLKNGAYQRDGNGRGEYTSQPVKLINFAVINDHGGDTGITSAIKNYMGITDLSCGYWGTEPKGYSNVHWVGEKGYQYARAGAVAYFMKTIRKADLNIITAEWVGWGDRILTNKATQLKTILAGLDPIALDYYSAKNIILPLSKNYDFHDPDNSASPIYRFLQFALETYGEGTLDNKKIRTTEHDFQA